MIYIDRDSDRARRLWYEAELISIVLDTGAQQFYAMGTIRQLSRLEFRRELRDAFKSLEQYLESKDE